MLFLTVERVQFTVCWTDLSTTGPVPPTTCSLIFDCIAECKPTRWNVVGFRRCVAELSCQRGASVSFGIDLVSVVGRRSTCTKPCARRSLQHAG